MPIAACLFGAGVVVVAIAIALTAVAIIVLTFSGFSVAGVCTARIAIITGAGALAEPPRDAGIIFSAIQPVIALQGFCGRFVGACLIRFRAEVFGACVSVVAIVVGGAASAFVTAFARVQIACVDVALDIIIAIRI